MRGSAYHNEPLPFCRPFELNTVVHVLFTAEHRLCGSNGLQEHVTIIQILTPIDQFIVDRAYRLV
jgi:hypothetical protein